MGWRRSKGGAGALRLLARSRGWKRIWLRGGWRQYRSVYDLHVLPAAVHLGGLRFVAVAVESHHAREKTGVNRSLLSRRVGIGGQEHSPQRRVRKPNRDAFGIGARSVRDCMLPRADRRPHTTLTLVRSIGPWHSKPLRLREGALNGAPIKMKRRTGRS